MKNGGKECVFGLPADNHGDFLERWPDGLLLVIRMPWVRALFNNLGNKTIELAAGRLDRGNDLRQKLPNSNIRQSRISLSLNDDFPKVFKEDETR